MAREKKRTIDIKLTIGMLFMLILLVGASYAYFAVGVDSNNYNKTVITGSTEGVSIASIQNPTTKLNLNVDSAMMSQKNLGTIYADDESDYVKTKSEGFHDIGVITLTNPKKDDNIYRCTANVTITVDNSANSILPVLEKDDLKVFIRWGTNHKTIDFSELQNTNGEITIPISLDIVGNNSKSIETYIELTNKETDQSYISGKDINIDIDTTNLQCELTGERAVYFQVGNSPLNSEENKDKIKNVYFVNYIDTSNAAFEAKDYTRVGTGNLQSPARSIMGWLEEIPKVTEDEEQYYNLYIGSNDRIYAVSTQYSSFTFSGLTNLEIINYDNFYSDFIANALRMKAGRVKMADCSNWETENLFNMEEMLSGSEQLKLNVSNFNTKSAIYMGLMFSGLNKITELDVSNFNTMKVTDMSGMFQRMSSLTELDVSSFYTGNVTKMSGMFNGLSQVKELNLSKFDTSKVTTMTSMFDGMSSLTELDVSGFNTSIVTSMSRMFFDLSQIEELSLSNFDTRQVTTMRNMFSGASALKKLDLSAFNTKEVKDMNSMFRGMSSLEYLDLRNAEFSQVEDYSNMFLGVKNKITIIVKDEENRKWLENNKDTLNLSSYIILLPNEIEES